MMATVKVPDAGYAYFGWWLNKPEDNTMPITWSRSSRVAQLGDLASVIGVPIKGNATYAGSAAGKYVTRTLQLLVYIPTAGVGHFTASTTLTAKTAEVGEDRTID